MSAGIAPDSRASKCADVPRIREGARLDAAFPPRLQCGDSVYQAHVPDAETRFSHSHAPLRTTLCVNDRRPPLVQTSTRPHFGIARALVERGCLLCPNGDSALGANGPVAEQAYWRLVDEGLVALVASDGHSRQRPPRLDQAHRLLVKRYGEASIEMLFDGSAIPGSGSSGTSAISR